MFGEVANQEWKDAGKKEGSEVQLHHDAINPSHARKNTAIHGQERDQQQEYNRINADCRKGGNECCPFQCRGSLQTKHHDRDSDGEDCIAEQL